MESNRFSGDGFNEFLKELIDNTRLDPPVDGISKLVIDKGYESLSEKQKFVFDEALSHYYYDECTHCGLKIPWSEMSAAEVNGGQCSYCQQLGRNDKD